MRKKGCGVSLTVERLSGAPSLSGLGLALGLGLGVVVVIVVGVGLGLGFSG